MNQSPQARIDIRIDRVEMRRANMQLGVWASEKYHQARRELMQDKHERQMAQARATNVMLVGQLETADQLNIKWKTWYAENKGRINQGRQSG